MDAQGVFNLILGGLMVLIFIAGVVFLFVKVCFEEWEFVIGVAIGVTMIVILYGIYVLSNLPNM